MLGAWEEEALALLPTESTGGERGGQILFFFFFGGQILILQKYNGLGPLSFWTLIILQRPHEMGYLPSGKSWGHFGMSLCMREWGSLCSLAL